MSEITSPRQTILVSCRDRIKDNLITVAWHMPASFSPELYAIALGKTRFSCRMIKKSKCFVVNFMPFNLKDKVTSPTFSLQSIYDNNIYHYDIYNKTLEEFIALGLLEEFEKDGKHFVEWGDDKLKSILDEYGFINITININKLKNKREYIFSA